MTNEEANELSMCGYGCGVIGGPYIADNPDCPVCNVTTDDLLKLVYASETEMTYREYSCLVELVANGTITSYNELAAYGVERD